MVEIVGDSVEATEFGCNGVVPQVSSAAIPAPTDAATLTSAVNSCITALEKFGFVAEN